MTINYPPALFLQLGTWHPSVRFQLEGWQRGIITWDEALENCVRTLSIECKAHILALELDLDPLPRIQEVPAEERFDERRRLERQSELIRAVVQLIIIHQDLVGLRSPVIKTTPLESS
jgi:hypothetical protein